MSAARPVLKTAFRADQLSVDTGVMPNVLLPGRMEWNLLIAHLNRHGECERRLSSSYGTISCGGEATRWVNDCNLVKDPEDEDENPIKPGIFLQNLMMGSMQAVARGPPQAGEERSDAKDRSGKADRSQRMMMMHGMMDMDMSHNMGGSDVFGFIMGMIKAMVKGVKSIIMNSAAGLSSGASKGSMSMSMGAIPPVLTASDGVAAELTG